MDAGGAPAPAHSDTWIERLHAAWTWATGPLVRMWHSHHPLDAYALVHMASAAGDALVAIALADSVFFSLKLGGAQSVLSLAALAFVVAALLNLRLPQPPPSEGEDVEVERRGRIPSL